MAKAGPGLPSKFGLGIEPSVYDIPVKGGQAIWTGAIVVVDLATGLAWPLAATAGLQGKVAYGEALNDADARLLADGALVVRVQPGVLELAMAENAFTNANVGAPVYGVDDETVAPTDGDGAYTRLGPLVSTETTKLARVVVKPPEEGDIIVRSRKIVFGDFAAAATEESFNLGVALPPNVRFLGGDISCPTLFSGGALSAFVLDIGETGTPTGLVSGMNIFTGATGFPKFGNAGAWFSGAGHIPQLGGKQLKMRFRSTDANVVAATAGAVVARLFFFRSA